MTSPSFPTIMWFQSFNLKGMKNINVPFFASLKRAKKY